MKKYIARILSCALVLGMLSTAAMAAEIAVGDSAVYQFSNEITESGTFLETGPGKEYPLYTVPLGTKITSTGNTLVATNLSDRDGYQSFDTGFGDIELSEYVVNSTKVVQIGICLGYESYDDTSLFCVQGSDAGAQPTPPAAPTDTAAPATTDDGAAYTVVKYDTLGQIALNSYGSYKYHTALYQVNAEAFKATGGALKPGMVLTLPDTLGAAKRIAMPVAGDGETLYTVKAGDTLGGIAKAVYGDVMKYQAIFERNSDRLTNANTIFEGQIIVLPAK